MPWEYIYAQSDEGLCPGLVPHAFKMLELHSQVKLHCRVKLFKMLWLCFMMLPVMLNDVVATCLCDDLLLTIVIPSFWT